MNSFRVAVLLAWIAGFVDSVGYIVLAHVFPAHMSGNTVAAASHFGTGEFSEILRRAFPIPMFVLGVFAGALIGGALQRKEVRCRFVPTFAAEAALLAVFILLTMRLRPPVSISGFRAYPFVALLALAMGLQNATLRRARGMAVRTTFISGMLVNMAERGAAFVLQNFDRRRPGPGSMRARQQQGRRVLKYGALWCGMFVGAACGAALEIHWGTPALWLPAGGLLAVIVQDFIRPISDAAA